ncbi:MAG: sialidase family protein [Actinomycetota bacterium]
MRLALSRGRVVPLGLLLALSLSSSGQAAVPVTRVITDTFTNTTSPHATAVEPDTFAFGNTVVVAAQVGRFFNGGASGIGVATSTDGGGTWTQSNLPGLTTHNGNGGVFDRVSDPSVAYDPAHNVWMVSSLALTTSSLGRAILISRSTDGGLTWGLPVAAATAVSNQNFDKNWTTCDTYATSPFYGNCYTTWDDFGNGNRLLTSRSLDGGLAWEAALPTANNATGLGGQPVVQPNGTVIVPTANAFVTSILAYSSTDGGASWSSSVPVSNISSHDPDGNLRSIPLPSAEVDAAGKVYLVWQDCRFRKGCKSNDMVMSTSTNGTTWSAVSRIPIDPTNSGVDHFIPGLGVDPSTSGSGARLGLTFYFYRQARCPKRTGCQLEVGYVQSNDGGSTWSQRADVAGPFPLTWTVDTTQGRMVGDYISTSWLGGTATAAFAVATQAPSPFDEAIYLPAGGLAPASGGFVNTSQGEKAVPGAASDHASSQSAIRRH